MTQNTTQKTITLRQACEAAQKVQRDTDAAIAADHREESRRMNVELTPAVVPPPGRIILRELLERDKNHPDPDSALAKFMTDIGLSAICFGPLCNGDIPITEELAERLERVLGPSKQFWLNLERNYREWKAAQ